MVRSSSNSRQYAEPPSTSSEIRGFLPAFLFRVPDRGSGNPTPLGGWDRYASSVKWSDGSVQAWQPYGLGLQIPPGVGDQISVPGAWWRRRAAVPRVTS